MGLLSPGLGILNRSLCAVLIGPWSLWIERTILEMCLKGCFIVLFLIIVRFWWKLVVLVGGAVLLRLRICDQKLRVLLRRFNNGGMVIALGALQVLFWLRN